MTAAAPPRTSFVIATRNRAPELKAVLERLVDTTGCPIIVVDNNSQDNSVSVARQFAGRVSVVELDENMGAVGRNVGVARCDTPYVAFCDDDSWWQPDAIPVAERIFDDHPTVGLLAARTLIWPDYREDVVVSAMANSELGHRNGLPGPSILGFLACSALVRKSAFDSVGGFSPLLHFRGEEQLLSLDMAAQGWDLCYCADLVAVHRPSATRPPTAAQDARSLRNAMLTAWLRRPLPLCASATGALLRAPASDREHARAAVEAARMAPAVLRQRRRLPPDVESDAALLERRA